MVVWMAGLPLLDPLLRMDEEHGGSSEKEQSRQNQFERVVSWSPNQLSTTGYHKASAAEVLKSAEPCKSFRSSERVESRPFNTGYSS